MISLFIRGLLEIKYFHQILLVSINRGTPTWTPKYCSPYSGDLPKSTPNLGKSLHGGFGLGGTLPQAT